MKIWDQDHQGARALDLDQSLGEDLHQTQCLDHALMELKTPRGL